MLRRIGDDEERFMARNTLIVASQAGAMGAAAEAVGADAVVRAGEDDAIAEAIKIATLLRALHSTVLVDPLVGKCFDACFVIYAAADERAADGDGLLGARYMPQADRFLNDALPGTLRATLAASPHQVYRLSAADERALGTRSAAFARYLKTQCAWDDGVERDVYAGLRPLSDLTPQLQCRARVTRADARKALAALVDRQGGESR